MFQLNFFVEKFTVFTVKEEEEDFEEEGLETSDGLEIINEDEFEDREEENE